MSINLRWICTACFEIRLSNGEALIIDPYLDESLACPAGSNEIERSDLICITHGHFDHILDVGRLANRLGSTVVYSHEVAQNIQNRFHVPEAQIQAVTAGDSLKRGGIQVEVVKAVHIDNRSYFAEQLGVESTEEISALDMVKRVFSTIENREVKERFLSHMGKYPTGVTSPKTEKRRICLMHWSGYQPCALMSRTRGSRWSVTMVTYYSNVSRGKRKKENQDEWIPHILEPDEFSKKSRKNWAWLIQKIGACPGLDPGRWTP